MGIYTRRGDRGWTGLLRGGRVRKDHPRIEALGVLDELGAALGAARAFAWAATASAARFAASGSIALVMISAIASGESSAMCWAWIQERSPACSISWR